MERKELEQKLDKVEAEKKSLTEQLEWSDTLRRTAEIRVAKLKLDLTRSREATENAIEEKEEAEQEAEKAKDAAAKLNSNLELENFNPIEDLAETELQCAVCTKVILDAMTVNCGHTFCNYCIQKWRSQNSNCPVCRTQIMFLVTAKTLDQFVDKMYGSFASEDGRAARNRHREERLNLRREEERQQREREEKLEQCILCQNLIFIHFKFSR